MGLGRGKLLLFGEHAAVYGHPAIGIATADTTHVDVRPRSVERPDGRMHSVTHALPYDGETFSLVLSGVEKDHTEAFLEAVMQSLHAASLSAAYLRATYPTGMEIAVRSTIPTGSGFGSSAALCAALATEFCGTAAATFDRLWAIANSVEALFHGTPSGIDTGLSLSTGLRAIYPAPPELPTMQTVETDSFALLYGGVSREGNTRALVAGVRAGMQSDDDRTRAAVTELGRIAREAITVCGTKSPAERLGVLCDEAQEQLRSLRLSTDLLERRIERARDFGARGGKLSGAGGGGAWFAVFDSVDSAREARLGLNRELPGSEKSLLRTVVVSGTQVRTIE
ncbi:MAG: hypothetical protein EA383_08420 [Spirochaetaceae bacterium]|nr:MAG: hypothetical protein EA383_08420 [Spirochaetaceae bacterium]